MSRRHTGWLAWTIALALFAGGCAGDSTTSLDLNSSSSLITISTALEGEVGTPLGGPDGLVFRIRGSKPEDRYYWTVTGAIPPELTRLPLGDTIPSTRESNSFALQGTPTNCGQFSIQMTVHTYPEHLVLVSPTTFTIVIGKSTPQLCPPPSISTNSLGWFKDVPGSQPLNVEGGSPPYTWSVTGLTGTGLTVRQDTGVIEGTPTVAGTFPLRITVADKAGRQASRDLDLIIRAFNLADTKGTWSGIIRSGYLIQGSGAQVTFEDLTNKGKRLSLLITDAIPGKDDQGNDIQVAPLSAGTLDGLVLDPQPAGRPRVTFSLVPGGGFPEPFNARIEQLNLHFSCNIRFEGQVSLECTGHSFVNPQYDLVVTLTRINSADQDAVAPQLASSIPGNGTSGFADFSATVSFNEAMSSSAAVALSGSGQIGPITFSDPTTAVIPLSGLASNTSYTLRLNPAGTPVPGGFMDLAGNALPETTLTFTTGVLTPITLAVTKAGTGTGTVTSAPPGLSCDPGSASCSADFSQGTTVTLTATPVAGSSFEGWNGASCAGTGACAVTLNADTTITATFSALPTYTLTVSITGGGVVETTRPELQCDSPTECSGTFVSGTVVPLTAIPDSGFVFAGWSQACSGTAACTLTMDSDKAATATFTAVPGYTLTVTNPGGGAVTSSPNAVINCQPMCSWDFPSGSNVVLIATPDPGFSFSGWGGSGISCPGTGTCNVTMDAPKTVTATFTANPVHTLTVLKSGSGTVTSAPVGINCGGTCSYDFTNGANVTLTAMPSTGFTFSGWSGACTGTANCNVTMNAPRSVTATFTAVPNHTLTITKSGTGTVTSNPAGISCGATCTFDYPNGTSVTLTATPAGGFTFSAWGGTGISCPGTGSCTVTMDAAKSVTATFTAIPTYTLSINKTGAGTGTVTSSTGGIDCGATCSATVPNGTQVTLTATSSPGSVFVGWSGGGCSGSASCALTVGSDTVVTATFDLQPTFQLTLTISGTGSGTVVSAPSGINCTSSCTGNFAQGDNVTLTATPNTGSTFAGWSGACTGTGTCSVTMDAAKAATATFTLQSYTLTVTTSGAATGTVTSNPAGVSCGTTCSAPFTHGTSVTLTATPASGYAFAGWGGSCSGTAACVVSMTAARTVSATFTAQNHTLTVNTSGLGTGTVTSNPAGISCGSTCSANFLQGTSVTLTATPGAGSSFGGWTGACTGTGSCVILMDAAKSVTVTFTASGYTLTITKDGSGTGTVTSSPAGIDCGTTCATEFANGATVTLTAAPDSGAVFAGWSGAGCAGTAPCTVNMTTAQSVNATFNVATGVIAYPQTFTFNRRQQTSILYKVQHAITLTGSSPNPGPLTFRITRFPAHQDVAQGMGMILSRYYQFVDPITGVLTQARASDRYSVPSTVDMTTGDVSGSPVVVYTPNICHDIFQQDTIEFVAIDSLGNVSAPATITMNSSQTICSHG